MGRKQVTISMSEMMWVDIEDLVTDSSYSSVSEYIRELIRRDMTERVRRQQDARDRLLRPSPKTVAKAARYPGRY